MINISRNYPICFSKKNDNKKNIKIAEKQALSFAAHPPKIKSTESLIKWLNASNLLEEIRKDPEATFRKLLQIEAVIKELSKAVEAVPRGLAERNGNKLTITSFDCAKNLTEFNKVIEINFPENIRLFMPKTSTDDILKQSFNKKPFVTIGPVGWSNIKPDFIDSKSCNMDFHGKDISTQTKVLQNAYEKCFGQFMMPVLNYLKSINLDLDRFANIASFTDVGIDKAVMTFAKNNNQNLITVGPYRFAKYINKNHNFPIVLENTVTEYGAKFSELSDITLVTGGREHAWLFDTKNQFIGNKGTTIPVDLFDIFYGIKIPSTRQDGSIENSARLLKDLGLNPYGEETQRLFNSMPNNGKETLKFDEQKALAAKIYEIYKAREKAASLIL